MLREQEKSFGVGDEVVFAVNHICAGKIGTVVKLRTEKWHESNKDCFVTFGDGFHASYAHFKDLKPAPKTRFDRVTHREDTWYLANERGDFYGWDTCYVDEWDKVRGQSVQWTDELGVAKKYRSLAGARRAAIRVYKRVHQPVAIFHDDGIVIEPPVGYRRRFAWVDRVGTRFDKV